MNLIWPQYADFLDHMTLRWALFLLPVGLLVLIKGADWLVDGAVAIAKHLGLSPLIIGLTIVAMGTSAPEVAASVKAALQNSPGIAVGNVYGSNIANLSLVGGLCAMIRPICVSRAALLRDIPLMLGVALLLFGIFYSGGSLERSGCQWYSFYGVSSNIFMLILFVSIVLFMIHSERMRAQKDAHVLEKTIATIELAASHQPKSLCFSVFIMLIGLVCLTEGADLTIYPAKVIGRYAGLNEIVIGATIVAVGTSLPELMTCLIAAFKGHDDLSVGNLVGSNIFNTLLVIGVSGLVRPYSVESTPQLIGPYYWLMIAILALFSIMAFVFKKISRSSGVLLFICYAGYIAYSLGLFDRAVEVVPQ